MSNDNRVSTSGAPPLEKTIEVVQTTCSVAAADIDHPAWQQARAAPITRYYSGRAAPEARHAEARLLWSSAALCVRFVCRQAEPLVVSSTPQIAGKTINLWNRDVCEIFVAPDATKPEHYFEFEVAPTGEWLDLEIHHTPQGRQTNWEFDSEMTATARVDNGVVVSALQIGWKAFGRVPRIGESWRANLFRCVGSGSERGYLAWQPTYTAQPNFHVPQAFGWLHFT